jgi:hypothetical protein
MATLYFNNALNTDPAVAGNYWSDAACTTPAGGTPNWAADTVHIVSGATMQIESAVTLALTVAAVLIVDAGGVLQIDAGGTATFATGTTLTLNGNCTNSGTLTAASGSAIGIASGKQLIGINGSTTTIADGCTVTGTGTVYPHYGATCTIHGVILSTCLTTTPSADKISVALEFASQMQSATARLPAHQSTGDYSVATLAATRAALITSQAAVAAAAYKARSGDATALATLTTEMETLISDSLIVASQAEVLVDNAASALL